MSAGPYLLLTGATGLLGRYLLRDLSLSGQRLAILARAAPGESASERIRAILGFWEEQLDARLPMPVVVAGDLRDSGLGLGRADRGWLARRCRSVIHSAANVSFQSDEAGEPWRTNTYGTQQLLATCANLGIEDFHYVSTAFVCGDRSGPIQEDELNYAQTFHNAYEQSKHQAEQAVRAAEGIRSTVYRPSVIVGDSRTGYTSTYHGFYRFLSAAVRLARPLPTIPGSSLRRRLPLRLPFAGKEPRNLVPVNWVARAVVRILRRRSCHGRTYHLVARKPTPVALIKAVAESVLGLEGMEMAGPGPLANPTPLENAFLDAVREYWPYMAGDPEFDDCNTSAVLPRFPAPRVGRSLLTKLVRFAAANGWGRPPKIVQKSNSVDCCDYLERFFPAAAEQSFLARIPIEMTLGFEIRGDGGGEWSCRVHGGRILGMTRGTADGSDVIYRTDESTFAAVVQGRESPQAAFFERRIEIAGSVEKGLKLAVLFGKFAQEFPFAPATETQRAAHCLR